MYEREVAEPALDDLFAVLSDRRSRCTLYYLLDVEETVVERDEIADAVSSLDPGSTTHEQVSINLHHRILPELEDHRLIEYDPRSASVRVRDLRSEPFTEVLELIRDEELET